VTKMRNFMKLSKLPFKTSDSQLEAVDTSKHARHGMIQVAGVVLLGPLPSGADPQGMTGKGQIVTRRVPMEVPEETKNNNPHDWCHGDPSNVPESIDGDATEESI
jgi:hypothetical protein